MPTPTATSLPASISGVAWHDQDGDGIQTVDEPLLQGITVTLYGTTPVRSVDTVTALSLTAPVTGTRVMTTVTGVNGAYAFTALLPGDYFVVFAGPPALVPTRCEQGTDNGADSDACRIGFTKVGQSALFAVAAHQQARDWSAGFTQPVTVGGQAYRDDNRNSQRDPNEVPMAGVTLILQEDTSALRAYRGGELARVVTGVDGNYRFTALTPDRYQLLISPPVGFTLLTSPTLSLSLLTPGEALIEVTGVAPLLPTNLIAEPEPTHHFYLPLIQTR